MPVLVIQARNGSTRFPRKVSSKLLDRPAIEWVLCRAKKSGSDEFILATSTLPEDDILEKIAKSQGYRVVRGDSRDVLSRYSIVAKNIKDDLIVRVTGDCPLIDPNLINTAVTKAIEEDSDYLVLSGIIDSFDVEVIKANWILIADQKAKLPSEREHVTPYIIKSKRAKKVFLKLHEEDLSHIHLSLDYPEDLVVIERILEALGGREDFSYWDVVRLLKENPDILKRQKKVVPS